nr:hypothetical protein [Tanacetum cinerariifolium]
FAQVVSPKDPDMVYFQQFKRTFGEDGNILVVGMQDSSVYHLKQFQQYDQLAENLVKVQGVSGVLGHGHQAALRRPALRALDHDEQGIGRNEVFCRADGAGNGHHFVRLFPHVVGGSGAAAGRHYRDDMVRGEHRAAGLQNKPTHGPDTIYPGGYQRAQLYVPALALPLRLPQIGQ